MRLPCLLLHDLSTLRQKFASKRFCTSSAIEKECENQINHNTYVFYLLVDYFEHVEESKIKFFLDNLFLSIVLH